MPKPSILLLSSTDGVIKAVERILTDFDHLELACISSDREAQAHLQHEDTCLALIDAADEESAGRFLEMARQAPRAVATVVITDGQPPAARSRLLDLGAIDCLEQPLNVGRLNWLIDILTARERQACSPPPPPATLPAESGSRVVAAAYRCNPPSPPPQLAPQPSASAPFEQVTESAYCAYYLNSPGMADLRALVRKVAPQSSTILLCGETGTGKTRLARVIHELSPRRHDQFMVVDCAALAGTLIESEIFGHTRGAFTGATRDYVGKFSAVGQGTLLLDEVDALSLVLQAKLLRAVDEHVFEPVGSTKSQPLQARLIVASNRPLEDEVAAGRFRADLYHRLNVIGLYLPPLRERESAITALAQSFLAEFAAREGVPVTSITAEALQALEQYPWPGNIRELRNAVQRAVVLTDGHEVLLRDLPDAVRRVRPNPAAAARPMLNGTPLPSAAASNLAGIKEEAELARLIDVLRKHGKNRRQAARELGISRTALYNKLNKYGLADYRGDKPVPGARTSSMLPDSPTDLLSQQAAELAS